MGDDFRKHLEKHVKDLDDMMKECEYWMRSHPNPVIRRRLRRGRRGLQVARLAFLATLGLLGLAAVR